MSEPQTVQVDVVSDVVCPWCYIGKKRLERALQAVGDIEVELRWRPYQLDPTIPAEGHDRKAYMLAKFGSREKLAEAHDAVKAAGADEGIAFDLGAIAVSPNTLDAHRLIRWAQTVGAEAQTRLVGLLFKAYFEDGKDIGERTVLIEAATEAGMDAALAETLLATDADRDAVRSEIDTAQNMGIRGVPCFLIENKYAVMGAQDPATLADAIRQVAAMKARGELEAAS
ncbi:DsbA family oxidoreductase [Nitratireductor alexandrii]|uniref:DsbA family oxidoreductase n=1 Tax=Nitratireductor alexandrii TaxID=2448161 RepID=UPI000FDAD41A|nr:DsbA family oxidoreductase [Nitratireductor alexandrii]